jgi:hypothetical protein
MSADTFALAGVLLVVTPLVGAIPVASPSLLTVWTATRERHIEIVGAHRRAWRLLNAGFGFATIGTAAGLVALAVAMRADAVAAATTAGLAVAYAMAGAAWCAVLAIRTQTTPALADLGAPASPPEPAEVLLGAATGGLFAGFVIATGLVLVALAGVLAATGTVAALVALVAALVAGVATASQLLTGDTIPAVLYVPTLIIGVALLAGWTG